MKKILFYFVLVSTLGICAMQETDRTDIHDRTQHKTCCSFFCCPWFEKLISELISNK